MLKVEVVYAPVGQAIFHKHVEIQEGAVIQEAIQLSGVLSVHPEVSAYCVGIFSKKVTLETPLRTGDRVEIYRPLLVDPKQNGVKERSKENNGLKRLFSLFVVPAKAGIHQ